MPNLNNNTTQLELLLAKVNALPEAGTDLPELTNEGEAADLLLGKQLIDSEGKVVEGTILTKTSSDVTASGGTITVPAGYYASQINKSVSTAARADTIMSVATDDTNDTITITASNDQGTGYVTGSNKTATKTITLTTNGATVTASDGSKSISKSVATATRANTTISVTADDANHKLTITGSNTQSAGYVSDTSAKTASTTITLSASGKTVTATATDGTKISKDVSTVDRANTTISTTADDTNDTITITASNNQSTGYVTGSNKTATKTISLTASGATVTASDGTTSITKSVATATQATPSITVDSNGKITASATQTAGYVSAGTKSATSQLTTKSATTITPTKSSQTAVSKNVYTTGAITVGAIPDEYITTSDATAAAEDIMLGETSYVDGEKITGTFTIENEISTQTNLVSQIQAALQGKALEGGSSEQLTPVISVNTAGLITATAGSKSATKQLDVQAAQTITPSTTDKTISSGKYLTGTQTIKGDSNLVSANIIKGKSIFGVSGSAEVGEDIATETTMYTDLLDELEAAIDNLPEAGEGGGSVSASGTATLTINFGENCQPVAIRAVVDNEIFYKTLFEYGPGYSETLNNLSCNSLMIIDHDATDLLYDDFTIEGDSVITTVDDWWYLFFSGEPGGNYTITINYKSSLGGWG